MRKFIFTYKELNKYASDNSFNRVVTLSKATGDIGIDAKNALGIFIASTGNLKKNEIISIQEIDENGKSIGEPITPQGDNGMVPIVSSKQ